MKPSWQIVTENLFERHMKPLLLGVRETVKIPPISKLFRPDRRLGKTRPLSHDDFLLATKSPASSTTNTRGEPMLRLSLPHSPKDIADNRQFNNLFEIWLEGDITKWRAMRSNGVREILHSGHRRRINQAWAKTVRIPCGTRYIIGRTWS